MSQMLTVQAFPASKALEIFRENPEFGWMIVEPMWFRISEFNAHRILGTTKTTRIFLEVCK